MKLNWKVVLMAVVFTSILYFSASIFLSRLGITELSNRDYDEIVDDGVLHVAVEYTPTGYYASGDTIIGFNHDLLKLLEKYMPFDVELHLISSFEKGVDDLKGGSYDLIVGDIPVTSQLKEKVKFTNSLADNRQILVQRKRNDSSDVKFVESLLDLSQLTIHVPMNARSILRIKNLSEEIGDTIRYVEDSLYSTEQLILEVASGDIDYTVCDQRTAKYMKTKMAELDFSTFLGFTYFEAWAVRKNSPILLDSLNIWIERVKEEKGYADIYNKYYLK